MAGYAPKAPVQYKYNGQVYGSMEELQAALAGGGAAPGHAAVGRADTSGTLARIQSLLDDDAHDKRNATVQQLFGTYAGADGVLQQHEIIGLARTLCAQWGIDPSLFDNVQQMFYRFDFSGDGQLDVNETKKLVKFLLKEQRNQLRPPKPGMKLGNLRMVDLESEFELGKKLGQGGQGAVYLATQKSSGTKRVVKYYGKGESDLGDIKDEFELLKRLDHPNIAKVCDVFEDRANIYVISEPYTGGDLLTLTEKAQKNGVPLTHDWLAHVFLQILEGIAYLHSKETMHCDLKEANVMIADDTHWDAPHTMLIDFGMAKGFSGARFGGTPGYMPPEFWADNLWTPKGDMFALAITFWGIYNSHPGGPFQVNDAPPFNRIAQATRTQPMDCRAFPPGLQQLVQKMAEKNFMNRPTAKQAANDPYFASSAANEAGALDQDMVDQMSKAGSRSSAQNMIALELGAQQNLGQMKKLNDLFRALDKDGDGDVETDEARQVLMSVGLPAASTDKLVDALVGKDGKIKYSEFMARMIAGQTALTTDKLRVVFASLDADGNGTLSRSEMDTLFKKKGMESLMEGRTAEELLKEMDVDGDGVIGYSEFENAMTGSSARPSTGFSQGDDVEYYSASNGSWIPAQITAVDGRSGSVQINVKPGAWLGRDVTARALRKKGGGGY